MNAPGAWELLVLLVLLIVLSVLAGLFLLVRAEVAAEGAGTGRGARSTRSAA